MCGIQRALDQIGRAIGFAMMLVILAKISTPLAMGSYTKNVRP